MTIHYKIITRFTLQHDYDKLNFALKKTDRYLICDTLLVIIWQFGTVSLCMNSRILTIDK